MNGLRKLLFRCALKNKKIMKVYIRLYRPDGFEYAALLKATGKLHHIGTNTCITLGANITDPAYVSIGNNCTLSVCTILGHDGVIRVLNNAYGKKLDSVGKTDIRDNCFIGHGAILMPDLTIGPNSVVAAGAVVTKDVPPHSVVGGVPAKVLCSTTDLVQRIEAKCATYPWMEIIKSRPDTPNQVIESNLQKLRVAYFYKK